MARLLAQDVVIDGETRPVHRRAADQPSHSPRASLAGQPTNLRAGAEARGDRSPDLHREVEQFLYVQAELVDAKHWQAWIDLSAADGVYWMPVAPEQTEWESSRPRSSSRTS